ncbi:MAG: hypothetical protein J6S67_16695 [Methanobrevibacter sp.]|nr:hypothetical protein [Methanobrevibacter sp.]
MQNYNETSKAVKEGLADVMKMENIPDEALQKMTGILDNMKELDTHHQVVVDKCLDYRDKYVKSITNFGTTENATEEKKGRTMEEIYNDVVNKK